MPASASTTDGARTGGSTSRAAGSPAFSARPATALGGFLLVLVVLLVSLLIEGLIILGPRGRGSGGERTKESRSRGLPNREAPFFI